MIAQGRANDFVLFPSRQRQSDMLAFEHSRHLQSYGRHFNMDPTFPGLDMHPYGTFGSNSSYVPVSSAYFENPSFIVDAPQESLKHDQYRHAPSDSSSITTSQSSEASVLSTASGPSVPSASSSAVGSPYLGHAHAMPYQETWTDMNAGLGLGGPAILSHEGYGTDFVSSGLDHEVIFPPDKLGANFVDPSLIQPNRAPYANASGCFAEETVYALAHSPAFPPHSPAPQMVPAHQVAMGSPSFPMYAGFHNAPRYFERRSSISSSPSRHSQTSPRSTSLDFDEESREKGRCPNPDCGRIFKDLKAHMLTHQSERPEKCPILNCGYNQKGFARKYDKNRHTLTHYKGTMVCGFCPGSGSAAEKSFNRADVFKRHLTSVHGVEQTAPNSRKRSPTGSNKKISSYCQDATGKCSTCSATFSNAQDFYEHLDDCVLRVVQQEEPSEAINQQHLTDMATDDDVKETMERHMLTEANPSIPTDQDEEYDDDEDDDEDDDPSYNSRSGKGAIKHTAKPANGSRAIIGSGNAISKSQRLGTARRGLTHSKGGVALVGKGRKKRKHYPPSWGVSAEKMKMKKRVLCVYDGERRLWKDDMMLDNEFEVRMKLPDGKSYVTDLDVETLKRAHGIHDATGEERGPWIPDAEQEFDLETLMAN